MKVLDTIFAISGQKAQLNQELNHYITELDLNSFYLRLNQELTANFPHNKDKVSVPQRAKEQTKIQSIINVIIEDNKFIKKKE